MASETDAKSIANQRLRSETVGRVRAYGKYGDSFDDIVVRILDDYQAMKAAQPNQWKEAAPDG